jgi:hypothetical protein
VNAGDGGDASQRFTDAGAPCLPRHGDACLELWARRVGISALAQDEDHVYYARIPGFASIGSIDKASGVDTALTSLETLWTRDLIPYNGFLYWSTIETSGMTNANIARVSIAGGDIEVLLGGLDDEASIGVVADQIYFAKHTNGPLSSILLTGGAPEMLLDEGGVITWIAADGNELFWIERVYLTGQGKTGYVLTHADASLTRIDTASSVDVTYAAALSATHIAWYNPDVGIFYAIDRQTGEQRRLADVPVNPNLPPANSIFAANSTHIYAITPDSRLVRASLDGGAVEELATNLDARVLVLDEQYIYAAVSATGVLRMALPR